MLCNILTSTSNAFTRTAGSSGRQQLIPSLKKSSIFCLSLFKTFCREMHKIKCMTCTVSHNNGGLRASEWVSEEMNKWEDERSVYRPYVEPFQQCGPSQPPEQALTPGGFHAPAPASVPGHNSAAGQPEPYWTNSGSRGHCGHPPAACQHVKH